MDSSQGPDGGSEGSYESVASDGGFEPAAERGRDPMPRMISSSHCIEVFRRMRCVDGVYVRQSSGDVSSVSHSSGAGKAGRQSALRPHNPLDGLPQRMMRFEGAVEAWLEELPPSVNSGCGTFSYTHLSDASSRPGLSVLSGGNRRATLWFFTVEFLQQLWPLFITPDCRGIDTWERALKERGCTIQTTHVELGRIHCPARSGKSRTQWMKAVFEALQVLNWSPNGEARQLLLDRRVSHTSMSIGDAIQIGSELYVVGISGFVPVKEAEVLLPQIDDDSEEDILIDALDLEDGFSADDSMASCESNNSEHANETPGKAKGKGGRRKKKRRGGGGGQGRGPPSDNAAESEGGSKGKIKGEKTGKGAEGAGKANGKGSKGGKAPKEPYQNGYETHAAAPKQKHRNRKKRGGGGGAGMAEGYPQQPPDQRWSVNESSYSTGGGDRTDRRALRKQFQAEREMHSIHYV